ncbi:MAG: lipocalin family protein [Ignavibacteria bacterium]
MKLLLILFLSFTANIVDSIFEHLNMNNAVTYVAGAIKTISYKNHDTADTKSPLIRKWMIDQIIINGRKEDPSDFEIEFSSDGTYYLIEDDEPEEGTWELDEESMTIIFNQGTDEEFSWEILTLDKTKLVVKETYGKTVAVYILIPWVDWRDLISD